MCHLAMHEAQNHCTALSDSLSHVLYFPAYELNISYFAPFFPVYTAGMGKWAVVPSEGSNPALKGYQSH